jgi:hypothetical protein
MFLRAKTRFKDGKEHRYWSIVENRRTPEGRVVQRQVLYLGEINDRQQAAWCRTLSVFDEDQGKPTPMALFPEDRPVPALDSEVVQVRLNGLRLRRPRQWGGVLAGVRTVGSAPVRSILGSAVTTKPEGDALAQCVENAGLLSADRSRQ